MDKQKYELRYLPLFYQDISEKVDYISNVLKNPSAAQRLIDLVEQAILERVDNCEAFEQYNSVNERKYPYYRIYVNNYIIYYVVIDDMGSNKIMEVRRFLYKGQDRSSIIW